MPAGLTPAQVNAAESAQWKQIIKQSIADVRCASPAFLVEDMNVEEQTVTVQIAIQERVRTNSGAQWWDTPPIVHVPVVLPRGGGFGTTLPLKQGDEGLLVFCDTCFDNWWANGQTNSPPVANWKQLDRSSALPSGSQVQHEIRRHYIHDCGFIPGMCSQKNTLIDYAADSMQIRSDDGTQVIELSDLGTSLSTPKFDVTVVSNPITLTGQVNIEGNASISSGASGTFSTSTGQVVTVQNGIIISIQ